MRGQLLCALGFVLITVSAFQPRSPGTVLTVIGILTFSIGVALMLAGWFALLHPIVPGALRGRFFGRLRLAWQSAGIGFAVLCALVLSHDSPFWRFQLMFAFVALMLFVRMRYYARIPEMEASRPDGISFRKALASVLRTDGYTSFCCYVFLLSLASGGATALFGLLEKRALHFGDDLVIWMGTLMMVGALIGFGIGGRAVDRLGTKPVFLAGHFGYAAIFFLILLRNTLGFPLPLTLGALNLLYGLVQAALSVAISTEMLNLIPPQNKCFSTSVCMTLLLGGRALSGLLCAWALQLGLFRDSWLLFGTEMSVYDTVFLMYGTLVVLFVVTLGLVPSVLSKAQLVPGTR